MAFSTYTTLGKLYSTAFTNASISNNQLVLNRTNSSGDLTLDLPAGSGPTGDVDYKILVDNSTVSAAIADAIADHIGILPALSGEFAIADDTNAALTVNFPAQYEDGTAFRFFVDGSAAASTRKYRIVDGTNTIAFMRNGEAYTFIFNQAASKFHIIPGIINPKSKTNV
jgi:hypothetical protein